MYFNMFGTLMKDWILGYYEHPLIVTKQGSRVLALSTTSSCLKASSWAKIPYTLFSLLLDILHRLIKGYYMLFLAIPCDCTHAKAENISKSGFSIIHKTCPIWIYIPTQPRVFASLYKMPKSSVAFTYLNTLFTAIQIYTFNAVINLEM